MSLAIIESEIIKDFFEQDCKYDIKIFSQEIANLIEDFQIKKSIDRGMKELKEAQEGKRIRTMQVKVTDDFKKEFKKLQKRFKNILYDYKLILNQLFINPKIGTSIRKSGGYRIITYFIDNDETINLITIYHKGDKDTISKEEILKKAKKNKIIQ